MELQKFFESLYNIMVALFKFCFFLFFIIAPFILLNYFFKPAWPINAVAKAGNIPAIKTLLSIGSNVNAKDSQGNTPLKMAFNNNRQEAIKYLIDNGADINILDQYDRPILLAAIDQRNTKVAEMLINAGANINIADIHNNTPLSLAVEKGNIELIKTLIAKGADVNKKDNFNQSLLSKALFKGNIDVVRLLLENGVDVNERNEKNETYIFYALSKNRTEILKLLIEKGADVNVQSSYRRPFIPNVDVEEPKEILHSTPLQDAMSYGENEETFIILLENGAKIQNLGSFLVATTIRQHIKVLKLLAKRGEDFNEKQGSLSALRVSLQFNNPELIQTLIDGGADIDEELSETPLLIYAIKAPASKIKTENVELLIENGANVNVKDKNGGTPLMHAVLRAGRGAKDITENSPIKEQVYKNDKIAKLLIKKGAKVNVKDYKGNTALKIAKLHQNQEMIKLLKEAGAKE